MSTVNEKPNLDPKPTEPTPNGEASSDNHIEKTPTRQPGDHDATQGGGPTKATRTLSVDLGVANTNAKLANPLSGIPKAQLMKEAAEWAHEHGLGEHAELISRGALVAQEPLAFESMPDLTEDEKAALRKEQTKRWSQPMQLYYMVVACSMAAAVQGMDESVINGAQLFFPKQFGIPQTGEGPPGYSSANYDKNSWILGLVNSAPYICCAFLGCWLTDPMNKYLGRRGAICLSAVISWLTCFWQGVTNSWQHLFVARLVLGLGIGPKSATVPVYAAECAPAPIRGALVMMWQMWTAFGIAVGYSADLAFLKVPDHPHITGLNWRLMLASAGVPAIFVAFQVWLSPESPRWLLSKGRYVKAFNAFKRLRLSEIQAARDLYYVSMLISTEEDISKKRNRFLELFTIPRNRRAVYASGIVMFMQQFCGVNVIAYYSSSVFTQAGFSNISAFLSSWGFGMLNFLFALPATYTIDTFGRRNLLLVTFPLMSVFLLMTGFSFFIPLATHRSARIAVVSLGIYLFSCVYSPGEGPVPFTYSAEAFPLYVRELGMSLATSITWFFNAVVAITFPRLLRAFTPQGAFGWYAAWNMIGWFLILLFVPETKSLTLEELDQVFSVPTEKHSAYQLRQPAYWFKRYILRQRIEKEQLYEFEGAQWESYDQAFLPGQKQFHEPGEKQA